MSSGPKHWTAAEDDLLRANLGRTNSWIAERLGRRSWQAVKKRRRHLDLPRSPRFWTPEQDQLLLACKITMGKPSGEKSALYKLAAKLGRTYNACIQRRARLKRGNKQHD